MQNRRLIVTLFHGDVSSKQFLIRHTIFIYYVPAFTQTHPLFLNTDLLKLSKIFYLKVCKLIQSILAGYNAKHSSFRLVC